MNRRMFLKLAAAFGLTNSLPIPPHSPSAQVEDGTALSLQPKANGIGKELNGLRDIERLENLLDDLNCIEVVKTMTHGPTLPVSSESEMDSKYHTYCPFGDHGLGSATMAVTSRAFWCHDCQAGGSAIVFQAVRQNDAELSHFSWRLLSRRCERAANCIVERCRVMRPVGFDIQVMHISHRNSLIPYLRLARVKERQCELRVGGLVSQSPEILVEAGDRRAFARLHRAGFIEDERDVEGLRLILRKSVAVISHTLPPGWICECTHSTGAM